MATIPTCSPAWADEPHFGNADALVDTRFGADVTSLCHRCFRPGPSRRRTLRRSLPAAEARKAPHVVPAGPPCGDCPAQAEPELAHPQRQSARWCLSVRPESASGLISQPAGLTDRQAAC